MSDKRRGDYGKNRDVILYALNGSQLEPIDDSTIQTCTRDKGRFYNSEKGEWSVPLYKYNANYTTQ